jgi:hypothetical protein
VTKALSPLRFLCKRHCINFDSLSWHVDELIAQEKRGMTLTALDRLLIVAMLFERAKDDPKDTALRTLRNAANGNAIENLLKECDDEDARRRASVERS